MVFGFRTKYQKAKEFYRRYERILMPATLVVGFVLDYVAFKNIAVGTALIVLLGHFLLAGATITFIQVYDVGRVSRKLKFIRLFAPLLIQFTFGALLGAAFIFYWFSGTLAASWPFILIIAVLMVANDALRHYFLRPTVQISVYYFAAFSFLSIALPFLFNSISFWLFILAGGASLVFIWLFVRLLASFCSTIKEQKSFLLEIAAAIFFIMNGFYFANIIPPVPLSLRAAGVYHNLSRTNGGYILWGEKENIWQRLIPGQTVSWVPGAPIYVYTAIFAPADLNTRIYHRWQFYDSGRGEWVDRDRLSFALSGGRPAGFRGYSLKMDLAAGDWRVYVETARGQIIGQIKFKLEAAAETPELAEVRR